MTLPTVFLSDLGLSNGLGVAQTFTSMSAPPPRARFGAQFVQKKVEPNSRLGEAITYCSKRWTRLTLFLRQAGAPLDSNIVERALKKTILHRENSLFYKAENGAEVGDLFMSLIHNGS